MLEIHPQYLTLSKLLDGRLFCIPDYQRAYSWTARERQDLFEDIERVHSKGAKGGHFMAAVVCRRVKKLTLGTNDLERASRFYDALLELLGAKRLMDGEKSIVWGSSFEEPSLGLMIPFDEKPATVGNGVMIALQMKSKEAVDALHARALELGGQDEGAPGQRGGFYAAYFRDLDGNKLNGFFFG